VAQSFLAVVERGRAWQLSDQKCRDCEAVVEQVFALLEAKTHTRQIMTKKVSNRII